MVDSLTGGRIPPSRNAAPAVPSPPPAVTALAPAEDQLILAQAVAKATGKPVSGAAWRIFDGSGAKIAEGKTGFDGVIQHAVAQAGKYEIEVYEPRQKSGPAKKRVSTIAKTAQKKEPVKIELALAFAGAVLIGAEDGGLVPPVVVGVKKSIKLKALIVPSEEGTYAWSTKSALVKLDGAGKETVTVKAGDKPSAAVGAEEIELVFTPKDEAAQPTVKTKITVVKLEILDGKGGGAAPPKHIVLDQKLALEAVATPPVLGMHDWKVDGPIELTAPGGSKAEIRAKKASEKADDARVEVKLHAFPAGEVEAEHALSVLLLRMHIDADRDGKPDDDPTGLDTWTAGKGMKGAVVLCNNDDDDGKSDVDNGDDKVNGADDRKDVSPLAVRPGKVPFPAGWKAFVSAAPVPVKVRIFDKKAAGGKEVLGPATAAEFEIPSLSSLKKELTFGIEATQYADAAFDGSVDLALKIKDPAGAEVFVQKAKLRVAPWIMFNHLNETVDVYVCDITSDNSTFRSALKKALKKHGFRAPVVGDTTLAVNDRWMQDVLEVGYSGIPGATLPVVLRTANDRSLGWGSHLDRFPKEKLLGKDYGWTQALPPMSGSSLDSFGNLEGSPPVKVGAKEYKLGRIIYGHDAGRPMQKEVRDFLKAQKVQAAFELDTSWLSVGHVDEFLSFIPSPKSPKKFLLALASPKVALDLIDAADAAGHGAASLFDGLPAAAIPSPPYDFTTVAAVKGDATFRALQATTQGKIDANETTLKAELGLDAADIVKLPVLFREASPGQHVAYTPGVVNMLVATRAAGTALLCIPKPFGPKIGGKDIFEDDVEIKIGKAVTGCDIVFIDDFEKYHNKMGEIHCGTNSRRKPPAAPAWWEQD